MNIGIIVLALWAAMIGLATYQMVMLRRAEKTCYNSTGWRYKSCGDIKDWEWIRDGFGRNPRFWCDEHEAAQKVLWWEIWPRRVVTVLVAIHAIRVFDPFDWGFGPAGPVADRWGFVVIGMFTVLFTFKAVHNLVAKLGTPPAPAK